MDEIPDQAALLNCIPLPKEWRNKIGFTSPIKAGIMLPGNSFNEIDVPPIEFHQEPMWGSKTPGGRKENESIKDWIGRMSDEGHPAFIYPSLKDRHPITREKLDLE